MKFHRYLTCVLILCAIVLPPNILAQENLLPCDEIENEVLKQTPDDAVELISAFNPAEIIHRVDPRYPKVAVRTSAEGWVQMSYVIDTNGNVQDPVIEDSGGHKSFRLSALRAIKKWRFDPASKNGTPTEQCHQAVHFDLV